MSLSSFISSWFGILQLFGEHFNVECLEQGGNAFDFSYGPFVNIENLKFGEQELPFSAPSLEDKMPFLQMLQSVESPAFCPVTEPNNELLLRYQSHQKKPWKRNYLTEMDSRIQALELESCITHDISEAHSPVKSETKDLLYPHSSSCPELEVVSSICNREPNSPDNCWGDGNSGTSSAWVQNQTKRKSPEFTKSAPVTRERKKRKRTRPSKNKEEVESQRRTHIAVERNRRRQMNDHLNALRSLMPTSFIQRVVIDLKKGDQASIIGGAIDFVKELEQLLQSLEAQKRMRTSGDPNSSSSSSLIPPFSGFFTSPQYTNYFSPSTRSDDDDENKDMEDGRRSDRRSAVADIEVILIQTHVNLKILSQRKPGQLLKAIAALEDLRLTILHLNITSLERSVEDECKLGSADEIAAAVHQIFGLINSI
ncbi:hypothetical protein HHK36_029272 [Tetracentron sinense]|uniref:BHLH domain-containing protein n=1 Tax=Tetracentron sinense TaxID=13715 RepID=A0A834YCR7_TETSI|nr:hypothetical protein HHK36_029272 [Tetracentron sinense]